MPELRMELSATSNPVGEGATAPAQTEDVVEAAAMAAATAEAECDATPPNKF